MKVIDTDKLHYDFSNILCHYCADIHRTVMARVRAKNIFGEYVEVCRVHYRKWCDADLKKLNEVEYLNGFKDFEEPVPQKYIYERG